MDNAIFRFPKPINEPVKAYAPGSSEKASLKKALAQISSEEWDIPLVIGGKEIRTGNTGKVVMLMIIIMYWLLIIRRARKKYKWLSTRHESA